MAAGTLSRAWERHGYRLASVSEILHFAFRTLPKYVRLTLPPEQKSAGGTLAGGTLAA